MIEGVLFDLDGTLVESLPDIVWALGEALANLGYERPSDERARQWIGKGAVPLCRAALLAQGCSDEIVITECAKLFEGFGLARMVDGGHESKVFPGAEKGLEGLAALGVRLAVVTNKERSIAQMLLKCTGLENWIAVVVGGNCCSQRKPSPLPLLEACRRLNIEPLRSVMVGDSLNDKSAAHAAGMECWGVSHGYREGLTFDEIGFDAELVQLADLPAWARNRGCGMVGAGDTSAYTPGC